MKRRLHNLATALSLLLCAAVAVLWVRGTTMHDAVSFGFGRGRVILTSGSGGFETSVLFYPPAHVEPLRYDRYPPGTFGYGRAADLMQATTARYIHCTRWGFMAAWSSVTWLWYALTVPAWAVMLLALFVPARRLLRGRRRRRDGGHVPCQHCGRDVRATPDRCPECGEAPIRSPAKSRPRFRHARSRTGDATDPEPVRRVLQTRRCAPLQRAASGAEPFPIHAEVPAPRDRRTFGPAATRRTGAPGIVESPRNSGAITTLPQSGLLNPCSDPIP